MTARRATRSDSVNCSRCRSACPKSTWSGGQRGSRGVGRVIAGISRPVPVEAHARRGAADGPQVPDVHGRRASLVVTTSRDPSGLKAAHPRPRTRSGLFSRASVRPVSVSTRRRTLPGSTTTTSRPSGEKHSPRPPIRRTSRQVPTSQSRHGRFSVTSHFPSGLKRTATSAHRSPGRATCVASLHPPDLGTVSTMAAGRQPLPVRADGDERQSSSGPTRNVRSGVAT